MFLRIPIRNVWKIITDAGTNFRKAIKDRQSNHDEGNEDDDAKEEDLTDLLNNSYTYDIFYHPIIAVPRIHCLLF